MAERLKQLVVEQDRRCEQLSQEVRSRDWERWQLLQLLQEKDQQLAHEASVVARQRTILSTTMGATRHYLALCALRAWSGNVAAARGRRALERARARTADARLRHACGLFRVALRRASGRQMGAAMRCLWLHGAAGFDDCASSLQLSVDLTAPAAASAGGPPPPAEAVTTPRATPVDECRWEASPWLGGARARAEACCLRPSPPPSEASTAAPSTALLATPTASSRWASACSSMHLPPLPEPLPRVPTALPGRGVGALRLAAALDGASRRRASAALFRLGLVAAAAPAAACRAELEARFASEAREEAADFQRRLGEAEARADKLGSAAASAEARSQDLAQQLAAKARWREEAERRIRQMVACGEGLEKERLKLRAELKEARASAASSAEESEALRAEVHGLQAERAAAEARARQGAADRAALERELGAARGSLRDTARDEAAARRQQRSAEARRADGELAEARRAHAELAEGRRQWAEARRGLEARLAAAQGEAAAAAEDAPRWRAACAEARAAAERERGAAEELKQKLARAELAELAQAEEVATAQQELRQLQAQLEARPAAAQSPSTPLPSTPQLRELDAYAELLDSLRAELARERSAKEAATHSLATLRGSYRMLLERSSSSLGGCGARGSSRLVAGG